MVVVELDMGLEEAHMLVVLGLVRQDLKIQEALLAMLLVLGIQRERTDMRRLVIRQMDHEQEVTSATATLDRLVVRQMDHEQEVTSATATLDRLVVQDIDHEQGGTSVVATLESKDPCVAGVP